MPWSGFFYKMALADLYVIFDHVQFKKRYFENRNQIVSPNGEIRYINVPVLTKNKFNQSIMNVIIDNSRDWRNKIIKKIEHFYKKSPYFHNYFEEIKNIINDNYIYIIDLNIRLIDYFRKNLKIEGPMIFSSGMNVSSFHGSDLILEICRKNNADNYLCGSSGKEYLKIKDFDENKIKIQWLNYKTPNYKQLCKAFIPDMSIIDLLFNHGEKSRDILMTTMEE